MPSINNIDRNSLVSSANENNGSAQNRIQNAQNSTIPSGQRSAVDSDALTQRNVKNLKSKERILDAEKYYTNKEESDRERLDNAKEKTLPREGEAMSTPKSKAQKDLEERREELGVLIKQEGITPRRDTAPRTAAELEAMLDEEDEAILDENGEINDENTVADISEESIRKFLES